MQHPLRNQTLAAWTECRDDDGGEEKKRMQSGKKASMAAESLLFFATQKSLSGCVCVCTSKRETEPSSNASDIFLR